MSLSSYPQTKELLEKSKKILLVTRENPSEDSTASLLAFGFVLEKMGKEIDMVTSGPILPTLSFLPKTTSIGSDLQASRNFIITLDTSAVKVSQLSYDFDQDGNRLNIYVTPQGGAFSPQHIDAKEAKFGYDVIIVLDSPDFETLGKLYQKNKELFYETPIINIDHRVSNKEYGEINLVERKASSCAEILYNLFQILGANLNDKSIATSLLVGIIAATKSFRTPKTTPQAFDIAAKLVARGADQRQIINSIFKNKTLATLKLWGRAFARVQYNHEAKLTWTLITLQDFGKTGAQFENLYGLEEELATSLANSEIVLVLSERDVNLVEGLIKTNNEKLKNLLMQKMPLITRNGFLTLQIKDKNLIDAEREVVTKIKEARAQESQNIL